MNMNLKRVTQLVIIGIACSFLVRSVGTFLPHIFKNGYIARTAVGIHLFSSLALVIFFLSFYGHYTQRAQKTLRKACIWAIIGSLSALFLHIKGLLLVFEQHIFPSFLMHHHIDATLPLVSSIAVLSFFVIFLKEMHYQERKRLGKATRSAVMGFSILALLQAVVLVNYLLSGEFQWLAHLSGKAAMGFMPILAFAVISILYFFLSFYRFVGVSIRKSENNHAERLR